MVFGRARLEPRAFAGQTEFGYDARGNRIGQKTPDPAAASGTSTATVTTQYAFDAADRLCRVVANATSGTNLETLPNPCSDATQAAGTTTANVSTRYTYDAVGTLATVVDATGATTGYAYDADGRMTSLTDPLGETLRWVFDSRGNRIRQENRADPPLTASVQWTYDAAGRILTRTADGTATTYTYDANGNRLTATTGSQVITTTYDRLNRPLTVDDEDAGTTADTTYTYSLASPAWTDPSGSYSAALDKADRVLTLNDPANGTDFGFAYRADGQPDLVGRPDGNWTDLEYDALGRLTSSDTDTLAAPTGGTDRAVYAWTVNRAGQTLSEASAISGDPSNGTVSYAYDPLGRLTSSALSGTTTTYGWDADVNRTSVQIGVGTPATTTYNAGDRPTSGANPTAAYTSDDDGRLTARPGYQYVWDHLGRLTTVKNGGGTTIATYSYDPLDRLRLVDHGGADRTRFRYVGLTTSVAQWLDDVAGTVTRSVANGWTGERLADWTGSGSNLRFYGTNGHHDVTWLSGSAGTVSQSLRYDPWGSPRTTVPTGYSPFRFQGSWFDDTTNLGWVITRWYATSLGRFISEDTLLGESADPPSRHLYAYGQGEPVGRWDPDGQFWYKWRPGDTMRSVASRFLGSRQYWPALKNLNRHRLKDGHFTPGRCMWVPTELWKRKGVKVPSPCTPSTMGRTAYIEKDSSHWGKQTETAAEAALGNVKKWYLLTGSSLAARTDAWTKRQRQPSGLSSFLYSLAEGIGNDLAVRAGAHSIFATRIYFSLTRQYLILDHPLLPPPGNKASTFGRYVFLRGWSLEALRDSGGSLLSHEYIHTLQWQGRPEFGPSYLATMPSGTGPSNKWEAPAYLWESWIHYFRRYGEKYPWEIFKPL